MAQVRLVISYTFWRNVYFQLLTESLFWGGSDFLVKSIDQNGLDSKNLFVNTQLDVKISSKSIAILK